MFTVNWNKTTWNKDFNQFDKKSLDYYGQQWGDPDKKDVLKQVILSYINPYINSNSVILEIGPGGGRWTKYLLKAKKIWLVDINSNFFKYLSERFKNTNISFYETQGYELDGIPSNSIDFIFTFGCFVHIHPSGIQKYLSEIFRVLKTNSVATIQYSDKTKKEAKRNAWFCNMTNNDMIEMIFQNNLTLIKHDLKLLSWSSIAVMKKLKIY